MNEYRRRLTQTDAVSPHRYIPRKFEIIFRHLSIYIASDNKATNSGRSVDIRVYDTISNRCKNSKKILIDVSDYGLVMHDDKIFIMGGGESESSPREKRSVFCTQMWSHNLSTGIKTRLPDMPNGRANFRPIVLDNCIYVFGGDEAKDICGNDQNTCFR